MEEADFNKISIIGAGLLGGSIGLAAKNRGIAKRVVGIGRNPEKLERAAELGAIDSYTLDLKEGAADADLIIICTPISHIIRFLKELKGIAPEGAIITDVGSTKSSIVKAADGIFAGGRNRFVGSHPMAGSEKSGVQYSDTDLFEGRVCFVTVGENTNNDYIARVSNFWKRLGSRIVIITPQRHDEVVARISHLPHIIAVSLVKAIAGNDDDGDFLKQVVGKGFLDTTRIAGGSYDMWRDILLDNAESICARIREFSGVLESLENAIKNGDESEIKQIFEEAIKFRRGFLDKKKDEKNKTQSSQRKARRIVSSEDAAIVASKKERSQSKD